MKNLILAFLSLCFLGLVNLFVSELIAPPYWFNHFMHFAGGFNIGWFFGAFWGLVLTRLGIIDLKARFIIISFYIFLGAVAVGALWEEYEFTFIGQETLENWTSLTLYTDTLIDMKMNRWGGIVAWAIYAVYASVLWVRKF